MNEDLEEKLINSVQKIWELNGKNRTNRLRDGFRVNIKPTDEGSFEIVISNDQKYFQYLVEGTYERKGDGQKQNPIIRKYSVAPPLGYPQVRGSYPYDKKGIEGLDFTTHLFEIIRTELLQDFAAFYLKNIKIDLTQ